MKPRHAGMTLIEMLVASLIMVFLGAALLALIRSSYDSHYLILGQNAAISDARVALDELADHIRGAQMVAANDGPLVMAAATEIRFYDWYDLYAPGQAHSLVIVRYWTSNGALLRQVNSLPASGRVIVSDIQSFAFTYYTYSGGAWTSASSSNTPSAVGAVSFTATTSINGATRQMRSSVQIRTKRNP